VVQPPAVFGLVAEALFSSVAIVELSSTIQAAMIVDWS